MMMQDKLLTPAIWAVVALSLALTSCGSREGAGPAPPFLVAGDAHTVAIKKDGTLWAWGLNQDGQLGNGTNKNSHAPIPVGK
jgi:alpha-tubulin suppressor-like RCC1 family protein